MMKKHTSCKSNTESDIGPPSMNGLKESLKEMMDMRTGKTKKKKIREPFCIIYSK